MIYISGDKKTDFYHPQLILKLGRLFADIASASSQQDVVQAGRTSTAFLGSFVVLFTFGLARQFLSAPASLLAASLTAASPGIVIHSHYLKEDIALTCFATASLLLAIVTAKESVGDISSKTIDYKIPVLWGLLTGLAIASKYTAFLLFPKNLVIHSFVNPLRSFLTPFSIQIKISGNSKAVSKGPWLLGENDWTPNHELNHGISTELLGYASYDLNLQEFTAFEIVSIGSRKGKTQNNGRHKGPENGNIGIFYTISNDPEGSIIAPAFVDMYNADWIKKPL